MLRLGQNIGDRNLVCAERSLDREAVHDFWSGPTLGRPQHDKWPDRPIGHAAVTCSLLNGVDFQDGHLQHAGEGLVHRGGIITLDEMGLVTLTLEKLRKIFIAMSAPNGRTGYFVAV